MRVTKAWYVEWEEPNPDFPQEWQKHSSRRFQVKSSADEFAELAKVAPNVKPDSVQVRTKEGHDKIGGGF